MPETPPEISERIDALLSDPGSPLLAGGRAPRPAQIAFSHEIASAFSETCTVSMIEADTGVGKTLGYLVPAAVHAARTGCRVIVSTFTLDLQKQVMETLSSARDAIEAEAGHPLEIARRVGRRNFVDPDRVEEVAGHIPEGNASAHAALDEIRAWLSTAETDELGLPVIQSLAEHLDARNVEVPFDLQILAPKPGADPPAYTRMVEKAARADILIVNHALLVIDLITGGRVLGIHDPSEEGTPGRRPIRLVVDEADHLKNVAQNMSTGRMPFAEIVTALHAYMPEGPDFDACLSMVESLQKKADTLRRHPSMRYTSVSRTNAAISIDEIMSLPGTRSATGTRVALEEMSRTLSYLQSILETVMPPHDEEEWRLISDISTIVRRLDEAATEGASSPRTRMLLYWTPVLNNAGFMIETRPPQEILNQLHVFAPPDLCTAFVSATLTGMEGEDMMRDFGREIGLIGAKMSEVRKASFSPDNFARMTFRAPHPETIPPTSLSTDEEDIPPLNPAHARMTLGIVRHLLDAGERTLILVPSYRDTDLFERLAIKASMADAGYHLLMERPATRGIQRDTFRATPGSALFSAGAWAGMDMPGTIRNIVIPRIPLPPPTSTGNTFHEMYMRERGHTESRIKRDRYNNARYVAMRRIKQGIGRGTRAVDDVVTVWILDPKWPFPRHPANGIRPIPGLKKAIPDRFRAAHDAMEFIDISAPDRSRPPETVGTESPAGGSGRRRRRRTSF